ncbi:hypothetical protein SteCoe_17698 [Stentor coeruleus]|uniref:Uncharacterized protein n=1 Tax=Stentor coeruleus TaxID=5963 RepID=A0A1R2BYN5_9CILI|nr:hypothetical protein SteCoe_17698 [Stentor coeruleus]
MGDLIFVPELGLITGKSQNFKSRMWYPSISSNRPIVRKPIKLSKKQKSSPFNQTQYIMPLQLRTKSPKRMEIKFPSSALEPSFQPRPLTIDTGRRIKHKSNEGIIEGRTKDSFFTTALDVNLQSRPLTMAGGKRTKLSLESHKKIEIGGDVYVNLPSLQQRPNRSNPDLA